MDMQARQKIEQLSVTDFKWRSVLVDVLWKCLFSLAKRKFSSRDRTNHRSEGEKNQSAISFCRYRIKEYEGRGASAADLIVGEKSVEESIVDPGDDAMVAIVREPTRGEREERTSENDEESEKTNENDRLPIFPRLIYSPFRPSCRGAKRETKRKEIDMRMNRTTIHRQRTTLGHSVTAMERGLRLPLLLSLVENVRESNHLCHVVGHNCPITPVVLVERSIRARHVMRDDGLRRLITPFFIISWPAHVVADAVFFDLGALASNVNLRVAVFKLTC